MERIAAVVVTYNRFELVKKTINALQNQTRSLDAIIVIDNDCTDGTSEWLDCQKDLTVIHQENVGGSGGFWRGIKVAYERGFDWIWCMDDDVFPREDCLESLMTVYVNHKNVGIVCPKRLMDGKVFLSENKTMNLSNILKPMHGPKVSLKESQGVDLIEIQGMTFEGPLISRKVVEKIGLPNKKLFILFDDTDFSYRAYLSGFKVLYNPSAVIDKHFFGVNKTKEDTIVKNKWKLYYKHRNSAYFAHHYGHNWLYRNLGAFPIMQLLYLIKNLPFNKKYSFSDLTMFIQMDRLGRKEILGKM